ncbi:MAG: TIGR04282 family arsenosugar biosynthesis glycosyltransferase [Crocinitomicaceae bacterium]|jgi:rSAM/selenodomain-associated transferase 1|nr:TIGR04282 family arsenosugar biosynthesis glycosyltransferase [Crocinitomicaceae bacterium]
MNQAIIVFQKNPKEGHTKTRLAATIGHPNAMRVYGELVRHAHEVITSFDVHKYLYFSDFVEDDIRWANYHKYVQSGDDLGVRMYNALQRACNQGVERAILIGTDCYQLTEEIISEALESLKKNDYCIGPALDGGYYLIGCRLADKEVFFNKEWSTNSVFDEAVSAIENLNKTVHILPALSDVDVEEDLGPLRELLIHEN